MAYTRNSTIRGPAIVTVGSNHIRTKGDVKVSIGLDTFGIETAEYGKIDERLSNVPIRIEFEPVGLVSAGQIALFYAPLALTLGESLFGDSDVACTITPLTGLEPVTFHAAGILKMPDIFISATKTTFGPISIGAILKNSTDWTDAAARLTTAATGDVPVVGDFDLTMIPTYAARIKWGDVSPWSVLQSREGVAISFDMQTEPDSTDEDGIVDYILSGMSAKATFSPMGCNVQQMIAKLAVQGSGVMRGASLAGRAMQLEVESAVAGGLKVTIPKAALKSAPMLYGPKSPRFGDVELISLPSTGTVATVEIVT